MSDLICELAPKLREFARQIAKPDIDDGLDLKTGSFAECMALPKLFTIDRYIRSKSPKAPAFLLSVSSLHYLLKLLVIMKQDKEREDELAAAIESAAEDRIKDDPVKDEFFKIIGKLNVCIGNKAFPQYLKSRLFEFLTYRTCRRLF